MTELDLLIKFWEAKLKFDRYLMEPSVVVTIESTIKYLKKLKGESDGAEKGTGDSQRD